jgi:hypothetical protein
MMTEEQKKALCKLLGRALIEIRILGAENKSEQAADLADALHNLPYGLLISDFSWEWFKNDLEIYHKKYPPYAKGVHNDFLTLAEQIEANNKLVDMS